MTNDEGTFEEPFGAILELTLVSVLLENNTSWTDNPTTYYIDTSTIEPKTEGGQTQLYTNANKTGLITTPIARLWEDNRFYYTYGYDIESDKYIILSRVDSTATPTSWTYHGYSATSQLDADNQVISGTGTPGTIYYNDGDNTWHISWSSGVFGALADDGYYAQGDISGVTDTKHLIGGVQQ